MIFSMTSPLDRALPYVIAEAGVNHNGDPALAKKLVDAAVEAQADAVKFQLFDPDELASENAPLAEYQERSGEEDQREMLRRLTIPNDEYRKLKEYAEKQGIDFITTPFDITSAKFLAELGVRILKIPSGEVTNIPFLEKIAELGIFTILSTGMCDLEEVRTATLPFREKNVPFALLHCVSSYPAPMDQINLKAMDTLRKEFRVPVGYSDHTQGIDASIAAAALGAEIIEKHFTLDRTMVGPDHAASLEPDELIELVARIRDADGLKEMKIPTELLGDGIKKCQPCEVNVKEIARRSLIAAKTIPAGAKIDASMIAIKRPGSGMPPSMFKTLLRKTSQQDIPSGTLLQMDMFS
jgi:N-acetylneuraminate synthase